MFFQKYVLGAFAYGMIRNVYYLPKLYHYESEYENGKRNIIYKDPLIGDYIVMASGSALGTVTFLPFTMAADFNRMHAYIVPSIRKMHQHYFEQRVYPYFGYICKDTNLFPIETKNESEKSS